MSANSQTWSYFGGRKVGLFKSKSDPKAWKWLSTLHRNCLTYIHSKLAFIAILYFMHYVCILHI